MPTIRLSAWGPPPLAVSGPSGVAVSVHRPQFRCLVGLPGRMLPVDGIIDTGAPLSTVPEKLWSGLRDGTDYEWLSAPPGATPFAAVMANWTYTFQLARFLAPVVLMDYMTAVDRPDVVVAFATGNPPSAGRGLPPIVVGLWGGLLEGVKLTMTRTPAGLVEGELEFP